MGESIRPTSKACYDIVPVITCANEPTPIYLDFSNRRSCHFRALAVPATPEPKGQLMLPVPLSANPGIQCFGFFSYSKASMRNVYTISTCRSEDKTTGIVLDYTDGTRSTLGWVSPGGLSDAVAVADDGMWILVPRTTTYGTCSAQIVFDQSELGTAAREYLHVQWQGELEWWFSSSQCRLHHGGKQTPADP